jgi:poly(U)-specific endoribonuclease
LYSLSSSERNSQPTLKAVARNHTNLSGGGLSLFKNSVNSTASSRSTPGSTKIVARIVTDKERAEMQRFLEAVMETAPMQFCHEYCHAIAPQRVPSDQKAFQQLLFKMWFELYRRERGGPLDSSGFEHVFVGEIRDGVISGFHNWIRFYLEEKKGTLNYRGYIKPKSETEAHADGNDHLLTLQFIWKGVEKEIGTSFIGVSPEFELAIYSICFLIGAEDNPVQLRTETDVFNMNIKIHKMHGDKIGTAYPFVNSHYET